jgi:branched-chain amino acid transport system ATP-binding protein
VLRPKKGTITLEGRRIDRVPAYDIVSIGICQSPEGRRIFPKLTTIENLEMGAFLRNDKIGIQQDMERVFELFPRLKERRGQQGGTLSGGEQPFKLFGKHLPTSSIAVAEARNLAESMQERVHVSYYCARGITD